MTEPMPHAALSPAIERALVDGDLSRLSTEDRAALYRQTCETLGLNPLTMPFGYLVLNSKLRLYALKGCTDQLRALHKISLEIVSMKTERDLFTAHVRARDRHGRVDEDVGFAVVGNLKGEALGNAQLKAISKAKRRVSLSICGLGMLDESEVASIPDARTYGVEAAPAPRTGAGETSPSADPPEGAAVAERGVDPSPPDRPSADDIEALIALAERAGDPREVFGATMRRMMGLGGEVQMTKKRLRETLPLQVYEMARQHYEERVRQQVEDDVPDVPPPVGQVA